MAGLHKILFVEDNAELCDMYKNFLTFKSYEVTTAADGEEGLIVAKGFKPDLIFLDIMMPKKDGFEVLKILRHDPSYECTRTKIVLLTNLGDTTRITPETHRDMDGYVIKAEIILDDLVDGIKSLE